MRAFISSLWHLPVLIGFAVAQPVWANEAQPTISVSGSAEIRVVPDQVILTAAVESRARSVAEACADNDAKIGGIIQLLKTAGIEERHVHTEYISIEPIMPPRDRRPSKSAGQTANNAAADPFSESPEAALDERPIGYLASRQFAITLVDLKKFESIYKGLIEQGINRVRGIEFRTSELRKHRDEARLKAVRAAKDKAVAMSKELGATLAAVKTISESGQAPVAYAMQNSISNPFGGERSESSDTFAVGQITVRAAVDVVFILGKAEMDE